MTEEKWVSMEEICKHLGSSRDTVKKRVNTQGLPGYKIDSKWEFEISEVTRGCVVKTELLTQKVEVN